MRRQWLQNETEAQPAHSLQQKLGLLNMVAIPALTTALGIERNAALGTWCWVAFRHVRLQATAEIEDGAGLLKRSYFDLPQTNLALRVNLTVCKARWAVPSDKCVWQRVTATAPG
jgi:hypothetical protein